MVYIKVIFLMEVNIEIKKKIRVMSKEKGLKIKCKMSIIRMKRLNRKGSINIIYNLI